MAWVLTWILQGLVLAAVAAAGLAVQPRRQASTRYLLWWAALAGVIALAFAGSPAPAVPTPLPAAASVPAAAGAMVPVELPPAPGWVPVIALIVWVAGFALGIARVVRGLRRLVALKRRSVPAGAAFEADLPQWSAARATGRPAALCLADGLSTTVFLGFRHPVIAVPRDQAERLPRHAIDQIVLHEYAHVQRRDDWSGLAEHVVAAAAWINPAVFWIRRQLALEREMACDDWVIARTGAPKAYARCLVSAAEAAQGHGLGPLAVAAFSSKPALTRRVERMLDRRHATRVQPSLPLLAAAGTVLAALIVVGSVAPPVFVDGTTADSRPQVSSPDLAPSGFVAVSGAIEAASRGEARRDAPPSRLSRGRTRSAVLVSRSAPAPAPAAPDAQRRPQSTIPGDDPTGPLPGFLLPSAEVSGIQFSTPSGAPGMTSQPGGADGRWWDRLAQAGSAVGSGSTTAGRATAGFLTRVGSRVAARVSR